MRSSSSRGMTWSASPCATKTGRFASRLVSTRHAGVEGEGAVEDRGPGVAGGVVENQAAGERRAAAEADEDHRPARGRDGVEPVPEPVHRRRERGSATGRPMPRLANQAKPPPSAIGARTAAYATPAGRCGASDEDLLLVRAAAVQQHDQRRGRVGGAVGGDDRRAEASVRRSCAGPAGRARRRCGPRPSGRTSPGRSSCSTGAAFSNSPQCGAGQHPHHLELVAVRVVAVDALGRAVAGLAGVGVEVRPGWRGPPRARRWCRPARPGGTARASRGVGGGCAPTPNRPRSWWLPERGRRRNAAFARGSRAMTAMRRPAGRR